MDWMTWYHYPSPIVLYQKSFWLLPFFEFGLSRYRIFFFCRVIWERFLERMSLDYVRSPFFGLVEAFATEFTDIRHWFGILGLFGDQSQIFPLFSVSLGSILLKSSQCLSILALLVSIWSCLPFKENSWKNYFHPKKNDATMSKGSSTWFQSSHW